MQSETQYRMNLTITMIRWFFGINLLIALTLSTLSAKPQPQNISEIKRTLGGGVNLSILEHYWTPSNELYKEDFHAKLKRIAKAGFKTVRLPVAFDHFLQPNSSNLDQALLDKLKEIYAITNDLKLNLIITYHYGKLNNSNSYSEIDRISWMWKQIQRNFSGQGYNNLLFELYNEPTLSANIWKQTITTIVQYLRFEDKNRTYIIGGTNYNSLDELIVLGKIPDENILYTFHFYEPYIFTHQGAEWTIDKTFITGLPYPFQKNRMPSLPNTAKGTVVERDYNKYPFEATKAYLSERFRNVMEACEKNNMPLICTESGVIDLVKKKYRWNYLRDIAEIALHNNVPLIFWDYDQKFAVSTDSKKVIRCLKPWLKQTQHS